MDKFLENWVKRNSDSGQQMLATYKDRLNFLRRTEELESIDSDDAQDEATDPQEWTEASESSAKDDN
jgi:hypothetical protein